MRARIPHADSSRWTSFSSAFAAAAEAGVAAGLAALDAREAAVGAEQPAQEGALDLRGREEDRARHALVVRAAGAHADAAEQLADGAAAGSQLDGPVRHLLTADPADQLAQQALVCVEQPVLDVVAAVDPAGLHVGQPAVADEVPGQLGETLAPAVGQLLVRTPRRRGPPIGRASSPSPAAPTPPARPAWGCR